MEEMADISLPERAEMIQSALQKRIQERIVEEIGDVCVPQLIGESTDVVNPMLRTWCRAAQWSKSCD